MDFETLLAERRSVRQFVPGKKAELSDLRAMLEAAQQAPSWKNSQTGRYTVVTSPELMERIRKEALPGHNSDNCEAASALIVTGYVKSRSGFERDGSPTNELGEAWGAYDLGLQNENLVLKARELGFDTLIMGLRDGARLRELLQIPEDVIIVSVISVGCRAADPDKPPRKPLEAIARFL